MKKTYFFFLSFLALSIFSFTACTDDDPETVSIFETTENADNLTSLRAALIQTGLDEVLTNSGDYTVFAPTDAAFQALLDSNPNWNSLSDIDNQTLSNVLLFHVIGGARVASTDLTDSYVTTLSKGANDEAIVLQIDVTGGVKFNGSANPVTTDIEATNGIIHIIDEVMLPPNVVELALNNPNFSILVAALTRSDLSTDFVSVLSGNGPFTIFAPTNAAFEALLNSNPNWNSLNDIPVSVLEAVLSYHAVAGANVQSDQLSEGQKVTTLGGELTVNLSGSPKIMTTSGQSVNIVLTDVQGSNGVIHVVDEVLIP